MADIERRLKMIKSMLRSTLISSKEGIPAHTLLRDYEKLTQEPLSFKSLGFNSLEEFIQSIPDVVDVRRNAAGEIILHAVADESNKHILKLVSKQKISKTRKLSAPRKLSPKTKRIHPKWESLKPVPWHATNKQPLLNSPPFPTQRRSVFERLGPQPKVQEYAHVGTPKSASVQHKNITDFKIKIARTPSGRGHGRRVQIGGSERMFNAAMSDAANNRQAKFSSTYEVPPRFRQQQAQMPASASDSDGASGDDGQQGKKYVYIDMYRDYCKKNKLTLTDFNTYRIKGSGFVSMITLHGETYGNGEFFPTAKEAEDAAAKLAVQSLGLDKKDGVQEQSVSSKGVSDLSAEELLEIKNRIKQIVKGKTNGMWATRLPHEYKEKFGSEAPAGLMDLVKNSFTDICKVELVKHADRELIYPVSDDDNKCKDLRIQQQELLPIGEKITVYLTYIYNCGYFCVQKEDSCVDQIAEELQKDCKTKSAPNMELLKIGQFCAGLFSADKCWTRAKIIDIKDSEPKMELLFVDYGDVERVLSKDIRWLSEKSAESPAQCIKCSLHGIQPLENEIKWSTASAEAFASLVKDVPLVAVTKAHYDETCDVDLCLVSDPVISISDKLIQQGVVRSLFPVESYLEENDDEVEEDEVEEEEVEEDEVEEEEVHASCPDPITLPDDKTWDVHVTFINDSTNSVMMRFVGESYSDQLDRFENLLEHEFKKQKWEQVTVGMICVAHDDELYHRVHVESIDDKKVTCFFMDHGDTNTLTMEQLRPLDAAINKKLPYQAVPVSLAGLEDVAENITVLSKLCELALGKTCVAEPVNRDDSFSVILYDTTGDSDININEEILKVVGKEGDVTAAIGDLSLMDVASKQDKETIVSDQKDLVSEEDSSKELRSEVPKGGSQPTSPKQKVETSGSATLEIASTAEKLLASGETESVRKDTSLIANSNKPSLGAENLEENTSHSFTNNAEQLTVTDVESRGMEPALTLGSTSKQNISPSGSSSLKSLSSEDESHDLVADVRTIWNPKEYAKRPIPPKVVIPNEGSYMDVHVIKVDSPSNFVCIPYEQMDHLNQLFQDMLEYFTPPPQLIIKEDEITLNHLYAGNASGNWYRVKVQEFVGNRLLSVYLVDIGEYYAMSLEELQPLPWKFWKIPMQAFSARLGGIKPMGGSWSEGAKLKFNELALDKDVVGLVISNSNDDGAVSLRLVDTSQEDLDICIDEVLLTKKFAVIA